MYPEVANSALPSPDTVRIRRIKRIPEIILGESMRFVEKKHFSKALEVESVLPKRDILKSRMMLWGLLGKGLEDNFLLHLMGGGRAKIPCMLITNYP